MRIALTMISVAAAMVMIGVSAALNYAFLASFGRTGVESMIIGSAGLAADIIKACLPWFAVLAWRAGRLVFVGTAALMFALLSIASLAAAMGFGAELRGRFAQERQQLSVVLKDLQRKKLGIETQLAANGRHRSQGVIKAEIAAVKQKKSWVSSRRCSDVTLARSRELCGRYFRVVGELRSAVASERLNNDLASLSRQIEELQRQGASGPADPQVRFLATLLRHDSGSVRLVLVLMTALVIEFGSGLGLYLAMHHSGGRDQHRSPQGYGMKPGLRASNESVLSAGDARILIERFCCERIYAAKSSVISVEVLFRDFERWAVRRADTRPSESEFTDTMQHLLSDLGLRISAGRITGIAIEHRDDE